VKAIVTRQELVTAMLFASEDESRYVLNGVCITGVEHGKHPIITATDGRRLVVIETTAEQADTHEPGEIVLRGEFIKAVAALSKAIGGKLFPWVSFEIKPGSDRLFVALVGANCFLEFESGAIIDQAYPGWRNAIPSKRAIRQPVSEIGLNADFVGDFAKAAKTLECETPIVQMSLVGKDSAIEVKLIGRPNFYGLVMQTRLEEGTEYQPEFLGITKDLPKVEKLSTEEQE
jgi:hypothetical protein